MSYADIIDELETTLDAISGLSYPQAAYPLATLADLDSRSAFDGAFLIVDETGPMPWPEDANTPSDWHCQVRLEVGAEMAREQSEIKKTIATRAEAIVQALPFGNLSNGAVYNWQDPVIERVDDNDRRFIWIVRFSLRYSSS